MLSFDMVSPSSTSYFPLLPTFTFSFLIRMSLLHRELAQMFLEVTSPKRAKVGAAMSKTRAANAGRLISRKTDIVLRTRIRSSDTSIIYKRLRLKHARTEQHAAVNKCGQPHRWSYRHLCPIPRILASGDARARCFVTT